MKKKASFSPPRVLEEIRVSVEDDFVATGTPSIIIDDGGGAGGYTDEDWDD